MPQPGRAAFAFIFVTVALDMLALGVIIPVLPKLILAFEGGDMADAAHVVGLFGTTWAAMQFLFSPVLGALSDRFGRRPVILLSNLGLGLDYVLMALAPSLSILWIGRVVSGITAASFSTAAAYIADVTPPAERSARFGMLGAAFGLGFVVGPAVGGALGGIDLRLPFWAAAALSLANAAYGFFILPESLPRELRTPRFPWAKANPVGSLRLLRRHKELLGLAAAAVLSFLAHESLPSTFVLYTDHRFGWGETMVGVALAIVGVCSTIVSAVLVRVAVQRWGDRATVLAGFLFGVIGFAMYGLAPSATLFLAVAIPIECLWALAGPAQQSLMTRRVEPSEQGQLQGALASLRGITGLVGPILFTSVFASAVEGALPVGAPWLLAALLLAVAFVVSARVTSRHR